MSQSPRWKPDKRKGYMTSLPDSPASETNGGNALLVNRDEEKSRDYRELWMYVTHIQTGWTMGGQKTQTRGSSTFYPMNLQQVPVTISGICPNQYEYDRLVDFVRNHQRSVQQISGDRLHRVDFKLLSSKRPVNGKPYFPPMSVGGHIESIQAGHERFKFHPTFQIQLKVTHDNLQPQVQQGLNVNGLMRQYTTGLKGAGWYDGPSTIDSSEMTDLEDAREPVPAPGDPDFIGADIIGNYDLIEFTDDPFTDLFDNTHVTPKPGVEPGDYSQIDLGDIEL